MEDDIIEDLIRGAESVEDSEVPFQDLVKNKKSRLENIARELKEELVGLDEIIDDIISKIKVWYIMPEVLSRPVTICLWGMTGVGKTDFVRRLARKLDMYDRMLEIQMGGKKNSSMSIRQDLEMSNIEPSSQGILLLDEIQRFRSISEDGRELRDSDSQDVWMLLSDGKFSGSTDREEIFKIVLSDLYYWVSDDEYDEDERSLDEKRKVKESAKYTTSYSDAKKLKSILRLSDGVAEIMKWSPDKKMKVALNRMKEQETYEGDNYSKLLIFISGNLDEAYIMSGNVGDVDSNADVLHSFSKKINVLTIKKALSDRFKPEQIARFGNSHIIYPSMSSSSYEKLIESQLKKISDKVLTSNSIILKFEDSVNKFIYRNGVIPAQGTRPVFSSIGSYIENNVPEFIFNALEVEADTVLVSHKDDKLCAEMFSSHGLKIMRETACEGDIDRIRRCSIDKDKMAIISVHEAGHAVVYSLVTLLAPTQIVSNTASENISGFVGCNTIVETRESILNEITYTLGGRAAEEIFFGRNNVTSGAESDIVTATALASDYYRRFAMGSIQTYICPATSYNAAESDIGIESTTSNIRDMLFQCMSNATKILKENKGLLSAVAEKLFTNGSIQQEDFIAILLEYGHDNIRIVEPEKKIYPNVSLDFHNFISQNKSKN